MSATTVCYEICQIGGVIEIENRPPRTWVLIVGALLGGLLLGVINLLGQLTLPYPWANLANSPAVWAVAAFAIGAWGRGAPWRVAVAGALLLVVAVETYYAAAVIFLGDDSGTLYNQVAFTWMGFGVLAGVVFGIAGAWFGERRRRLGNVGVAMLSGVFAAEALRNVGVGLFDQATSWILAGIALLIPLVLGRSMRQRLESLALAVPLALMGLLGYLTFGMGG